MDMSALEAKVRSGEIDTVLVVFPDMQGRLLGKRVTGHFFLKSAKEGTHACNYLLATDMEMETVPGFRSASWDKGYGDFTLVPDLRTLRPVGWLEATAMVLCDVTDHHGHPLPVAPRTVLQTQVKRLKERGWVANTASELEFYVFNDSFRQAHQKGYRDLEPAGSYIQDYHILQTTKEEPLLRAIRNHMDAAGVVVESSKGEWGPGQEEVNFAYADALESADRHVIFKHGAKEIAVAQGCSLTFMAKWRAEYAGSSCHIHASLWDEGGSPLFADASDPLGMSKTFKQFLAGNLALAKDLTLLLAPTINSYKRFCAGSFAPTKAVWSGDNRTAGFRVVGAGPSLRVECRIGGADLNPYLAYAGIIAAGLYGIEQQLELPPACEGDAYRSADAPEVPKNLRDAIDAFEGSKALRAALGDEVVEHYAHAARWEQREFDRKVTDWEVARNFERC